MTLSGCFIALAMLAESPYLAAVVLAGGAGTLYLAQSVFWSVSADLAGASAGAVSGVMNMGAQIGGAATAMLTPVIARHFGWPASFLATTAMCLAGAAAWLTVNPSARLKTPSAPV